MTLPILALALASIACWLGTVYVTLRVIPFPPNATIIGYTLARCGFSRMFALAGAWCVGEGIAVVIFLLGSSLYQLAIYLYVIHFHVVPSLPLIYRMRRESLDVMRQLTLHSKSELALVACIVVGIAIGCLGAFDIDGSDVRLNRAMAGVAIGGGVGWMIVILCGWALNPRAKTESGNTFSYHQLLKIFGPFWWQIAQLVQHGRSTELAPLNVVTIEGAGRNPPANIVFIQLESLGVPMVTMKQNGRRIAPWLHGLSARSLYFPQVISAKGRGGTSDIEIAMFTGREPMNSAPMFDEDYDYSSSIFRALAGQGYRSFAFHGNTGAFFRRAFAYREMGVDFYDQERMRLASAGWGAPDGAVFEFADRVIAGTTAPFCAAIITMTAHTPFSNIEVIEAAFDGPAGDRFSKYCRSVSYMDREVRKFVEKMQIQHPRTVFVIYGDHGARVAGHHVSEKIVLPTGARDLVPAWIITPDGASGVEPAPITMPELALTSLGELGIPLVVQTSAMRRISANSQS